MRKFLFFLLCTVTFYLLASCEKEEHLDGKGDKPLVDTPKDTIQEEFLLKWDTFIDDSNDNGEIFIGTQYLGIQGWSHLATPPYIYIGAVFPESTFTTTFDKEIVGKKKPIYLTFDFPDPYITSMETVKGSEYLQKIKEAISSKEYQSYTSPQRPHIVKFAELKSLSNIESCFPYNKDFGNTLKKIALQEFNVENIKSLCIGEVIFKGFTTSMDVPSNGLFTNEPTSFEKLIYIRSLTYGVSAYFIVASEAPYKEVLTAFKDSFMDDYNNPKGVLHNSKIILLTTSDINQEAEVKATFNDLNNFLKNPFMGGKIYGYPIYCTGFYVKNNKIFTRES